ncbi:cytochrome o ubiquinol oxidase subunit IV [Lichenifustis flavocetrariae]|uniref:Cytochrome bo(3) ubiquinol oxidase subunit 4 n=1 Tax=Lichenifustis flavocetrariae TaxID=2949735 RepID=A0AA41YQ63_9HYPH|nr:cytochrome o ubiquinol oxidase subunit IV [Lichenifustis flavocetrariae]MCW6506501.1 cytochrome o ubiquinol oxidase subunit IV [Lichenifustis flavocetrariae]
MSDQAAASQRRHEAGRTHDKAPGEPHEEMSELTNGVRNYLIGLGLAALLTAGSFVISETGLIYGPVVPIALIVFAIAQMGVHLVFFLHLTTAPDNLNNAMALAFGVLIVLLLIGGSLWIMSHLNHNMAPMDQMMQMQH